MRVWKSAELLSIAESYGAKEVVVPAGDKVVVEGIKRESSVHYQGVTFKFRSGIEENHCIVVTDSDEVTVEVPKDQGGNKGER